MAWSDDEPVRGGYAPLELLGLPGLSRMRAGESGYLAPPPIHHLTGLRPLETGDGTSTFTMPVSRWLEMSIPGVYVPAASAVVADAPLGSAVLSRVDAGVFGVTSELSISYMRPIHADSKTLYAHATVIDVGRSQGLSQAVVEDEHGRVLSHLTSRYLLQRIPEIPDASTLEQVELPSFDTPDPHQRPVEPQSWDKWMQGPGLDWFQAAAEGTCPDPPFARLFGMRCIAADPGTVTFEMPASRWFTSPAATIYGGIIALWMDVGMTAAVTTTLPAGSSCANLDFKIHYLRPGIADGRPIRVRADVVHRGRRVAVTRVELVNADGKALAVGTGSLMVLEGRPWQPVELADDPASTD